MIRICGVVRESIVDGPGTAVRAVYPGAAASLSGLS